MTRKHNALRILWLAEVLSSTNVTSVLCPPIVLSDNNFLTDMSLGLSYLDNNNVTIDQICTSYKMRLLLVSVKHKVFSLLFLNVVNDMSVDCRSRKSHSRQ